MYYIGIFGSAEREAEHVEEIAKEIGLELGKRRCGIITGACSGLPYIAAHAAASAGATEVHGYSPMHDLEGQRRFTPDDDLSLYTRLHFLPDNLPAAGDIEVAKKYRNVTSTARCDAGIIIAGGWGTLHEVCSLTAYGKVVGTTLGTGGVADTLPQLFDALRTKTKAQLIAASDPKELVARLVEELGRG